MIEAHYEQLAEYLRGMMADGVQLVHGGHLFDWNDTKIPKILAKIDNARAEANKTTCDVGDLLQNIYTNQKSAVVQVTDKDVQLVSDDKIVVFPKDKLWFHYRKSRPGEK
jgi:hypothetical protein